MGRNFSRNPKLTARLRQHDMDSSGANRPLGQCPRIIADLAPAWHKHVGAQYALIGFNGGHFGRAHSDLIPDADAFTALAQITVKALSDLFQNDAKRTELYGPEAADLLTVSLQFSTGRLDRDSELAVMDGQKAKLPAGTPLTCLEITHTPVPIGPDRFAGGVHPDYPPRERCVSYATGSDQRDAVVAAWNAVV